MPGKSDLDLDFDDIVPPKKKTKKKQKVTRKKETKDRIMIAIPTEEPHKFLNKDIFECTAEEFVTWAKSVYPDVGAAASKFQMENETGKSNRIAALNQIQNYWTSTMTRTQLETLH